MGSGSMMTTKTFLRPQEWVGDGRVLVDKVSRQWGWGGWVGSGQLGGHEPPPRPKQQGQLAQQVGFIVGSYGSRKEADFCETLGSTVEFNVGLENKNLGSRGQEAGEGCARITLGTVVNLWWIK